MILGHHAKSPFTYCARCTSSYPTTLPLPDRITPLGAPCFAYDRLAIRTHGSRLNSILSNFEGKKYLFFHFFFSLVWGKRKKISLWKLHFGRHSDRSGINCCYYYYYSHHCSFLFFFFVFFNFEEEWGVKCFVRLFR